MRQRQKGRVLSCGGCGLLIDRQLDAAINLYLRMRGFPPSQGVWEEYIIPALRRSGVALIGAKADGALPMNPEGDEADEAQGVQLSPEPRKIVLLS